MASRSKSRHAPPGAAADLSTASASVILMRNAGPFLPDLMIGEQRNVNPAHDGTRLESSLLRIARPIPIGERNAARRSIRKTLQWRNEAVELWAVISQRCGPYLPIELRVGASIIEWQAVF